MIRLPSRLDDAPTPPQAPMLRALRHGPSGGVATALWLWASCLALLSCSVHQGQNPAQRCTSSTECPANLICYRSFCLTGPERPGGVQPDELHPSADGRTGLSDAGVALDSGLSSGDDASAAAAIHSDDGGVPVAPGSLMQAADASTSLVDGTSPAAPAACERALLRQHADAYLAAMASGDVASLHAHAHVRYTENGETQQLGSGLWSSRPKLKLARQVFDEAGCGAAIVAVLNGTDAVSNLLNNTGTVIFAVRLRYLDDQLLEVEAQVVTANFQFFNPDALLPAGSDPWVEPVADVLRGPRAELSQLVSNYFDSPALPSLLPPSADGCKRRQDGVLMAKNGSCGVPPGDHPFTEKRYPLFDETNGIATAVVLYDGFLGMYFLKVSGGVIQNIEIVGGAQSQSSGW